MKFKKSFPLFITVVFFISLASCTTEPDLTGVPEVSFNNDVKRIISANCSFEGCHKNDLKKDAIAIDYNRLMSFGDVKAGDAHGSKLYRLITGRSGPKMPPSGYNEVSSADIKTLYIWIEQGAKNN